MKKSTAIDMGIRASFTSFCVVERATLPQEYLRRAECPQRVGTGYLACTLSLLTRTDTGSKLTSALAKMRAEEISTR
jgi:hypothetical protein